MSETIEDRGNRKIVRGVVATAGMDKSVIVQVETQVKHPRYKKIIRRRSKFMAHDENNECGVGDLIEIMEIRPMSKRKRWRLVSIVEKSKLSAESLKA